MKNRDHKQLLILLIIPFATFIVNIDNTIVNIVFPTLIDTFHTDLNTISRVSLAYLLSFVSTLLIFGRLGDLKGAESVFKYGFLWFGIASALCGFAQDIHQLVLFRFLQGVGGAMILSSFAAIVSRNISEERRGSAFGLGTVFGGIGFALGAPIGGFLVQYLSWQWVFFINIPFCITAFVLCSLYLKNRAPKREQKMDYAGAIISFVMLCSFVLTLSLFGSDTVTLPFKIATALIFIITLPLFIWLENRINSPLLDLSLFKIRDLKLGLISLTIILAVMGGFNFIFPFFFEEAYGLSTSQAGLILMSYPILTIIIAPISGRLCDRGHERAVNFTAILLISLSLLGFYFFNTNTPLYVIIPIFMIYGCGISLFSVANITQIMSCAPKSREGLAGSLNSGFTFIGSIIGISIFQILFSHESKNAIDPETVNSAFHSVVIYSWLVIIPLITFALLRLKKNTPSIH